MQTPKVSLAIAGSTQHTLMCAQALYEDDRLQISWILTPAPKRVGRKQQLTKNPLHLWAEQEHIPLIFVEKNIDQQVKAECEAHQLSQNIDILLVVDFGYFIPNWLLKLPTVAPLNIHPSDLPKYRGSSPGQYTLLYGEEFSAISVIVMNDKLDQGDLIYQDKFTVTSTWNAQDFYTFAFEKISEQIANIIVDVVAKKRSPTPQPLASPTPIAGRFTRDDGFVDWSLIQGGEVGKTSKLLQTVNQTLHNWPLTIANAVRALSPWPGVWTLVNTEKGVKRMKILSLKINQEGKLKLGQVQLEGEASKEYSVLKKEIIENR